MTTMRNTILLVYFTECCIPGFYYLSVTNAKIKLTRGTDTNVGARGTCQNILKHSLLFKWQLSVRYPHKDMERSFALSPAVQYYPSHL